MEREEYDRYNPLEAATTGRDSAGQDEIYEKFSTLSDAFRKFLVSPQTAQKLADWEHAGLFPPNYRTAVAKTVMLTSLGEVEPKALGLLFERIGLPKDQALLIASGIRTLVEPYLNAPEPEIPEVILDPEAREPEELREVPPLTGTISPEIISTPTIETKPIPSVGTEEPAESQQTIQNPSPRNVVDLRNLRVDREKKS